MKKYTIKEFAEGKKAVKIENEEQWKKLNKVHKLTHQYWGVWEYSNKQGYSQTENWYIDCGYEVLEFSQLDFEDELVVGKWYKYSNWYLKLKKVREDKIFIASESIDSQKRYNKYKKPNFTCGIANYQKVLLTDLSEIQQYLPEGHVDLMKKDTFVLPEKWAVKITKDNVNFISEKRKWGSSIGYYCTSRPLGLLDWGYNVSILPQDYTEITFEEFKTHILKESTMQEIKVGDQFKVSGESANTIYTFNRIEGNDVDVTWDIAHHVHYYLSTCLDNIKGGSWILVNKEKTMEKEIIGYKLVKQEYEKATIKLLGWNFTTKLLINISEKGDIHRLKEAGVLDLWFEKVYAPEFKKDDYVTVVSIGTYDYDSSSGYTEPVIGKTYKIYNVNTNYVSLDVPNGRIAIKSSDLRKATEDEVKKAQIQLPTINGKQCVDNGDKTITCGCTTKSFDWILGVDYAMGDDIYISNTKVTQKEIKQIVEYINKK